MGGGVISARQSAMDTHITSKDGNFAVEVADTFAIVKAAGVNRRRDLVP